MGSSLLVHYVSIGGHLIRANDTDGVHLSTSVRLKQTKPKMGVVSGDQGWMEEDGWLEESDIACGWSRSDSASHSTERLHLQEFIWLIWMTTDARIDRRMSATRRASGGLLLSIMYDYSSGPGASTDECQHFWSCCLLLSTATQYCYSVLYVQ
jgi:hypothetical protein